MGKITGLKSGLNRGLLTTKNTTVKSFVPMNFYRGKRTTIITAVSCLPGLILTNVYTIGCRDLLSDALLESDLDDTNKNVIKQEFDYTSTAYVAIENT